MRSVRKISQQGSKATQNMRQLCVTTLLFLLSDATPLWFHDASRNTFISAPSETVPSLQAVPFFLFFLLYSLKRHPSESMTKEVIPHNVTIFPYIKEVTLRYWNQRCATQDFPFYLREIKGWRRLPTNNHLAPLPRAFWPSLTKAVPLFTTLGRTGSFLQHVFLKLKICQHLQTFEKSFSKWSWVTWFAIRGAVSSPPRLRLLNSVHVTENVRFTSCQQLPWSCCLICQSPSSPLSSVWSGFTAHRPFPLMSRNTLTILTLLHTWYHVSTISLPR